MRRNLLVKSALVAAILGGLGAVSFAVSASASEATMNADSISVNSTEIVAADANTAARDRGAERTSADEPVRSSLEQERAWDDPLAFTGANVAGLIAVLFGLLAAAGVVLMISRRHLLVHKN